jgi:hypothetical protein
MRSPATPCQEADEIDAAAGQLPAPHIGGRCATFFSACFTNTAAVGTVGQERWVQEDGDAGRGPTGAGEDI